MTIKTDQACRLVDHGNVMLSKGQFAQAEDFYREALEISPDYARAHYNLGVVLKIQGRLEAAAASYQASVLSDPADDEAYNNLGVIYRELDRIDEAMASYQQALLINPGNPNAHNNLGVVLREQGRMEEAEASYRQALNLKPDFANALNNLAVIYEARGEIVKAADFFREAIAVQPDFPQAQTYLAIISWINDELQSCRKYLEQIENTSSRLSAEESKFVSPYHHFLSRLYEYRQSYPELYPEKGPLPVIYAIGDSYSLSPANIGVQFHGDNYCVSTKIVIGCKAWHLGNSQRNRFKYSFEKLCREIPAGKSVLMMFGDIDCRLDEGIIAHHRKYGGDLVDLISGLVADYVAYVVKICNGANISPIICDIAMPLLDEVAGASSDRELLVLVIDEFNLRLAEVLDRREIPLLEVSSLSKNREIVAGQGCHIDTRHLVPAVYSHLIGKL